MIVNVSSRDSLGNLKLSHTPLILATVWPFAFSQGSAYGCVYNLTNLLLSFIVSLLWFAPYQRHSGFLFLEVDFMLFSCSGSPSSKFKFPLASPC